MSSEETTPERRQTTILFCDLVDSTRSSVTRDLEDHREILRSFQKACDAVIANYAENEEVIIDYIGDGVVVVFGFPKGREDDAERAVRAGLKLITAIENLSTLPNVHLQAHIGIATDIGVIGDSVGTGALRKTTVIGPAPNLASRLQGIARPGEVVVSDKTQKLIAELFYCEDLGPKSLKGFDAPVRAWKILGQRPGVISHSDAMRGKEGLGPMVGRLPQLATLTERWKSVKDGKGQVVTLLGEAGIGKSRLVKAFLDNISGDRGELQFFTGPGFTHTTLYPVIQRLEQQARIKFNDSPTEKFHKLEVLVAKSACKASTTLPYLATLLSLPPKTGYEVIQNPPELQKHQTLAALKAFILGFESQKPLVLVWEDLHWADQTTKDLLKELVAEIVSLPIFMLATARPDELTPIWNESGHTSTITLARLESKDAETIVTRLIAEMPLPLSTFKEILDRGDGIPLFLEELTKAVVETNADDANRAQPLARRSPSDKVPTSLRSSLMARLDRLEAGKEIALLASVIGREFSYDLLATVHKSLAEAADRTRGDELINALNRLVDADLIHALGTRPNCNYLFKHALIQQEAYDSMLREKRKPLHKCIADALETRSETGASMPELLAHHLTEAGQYKESIPYWKNAGDRAQKRAAYEEGCNHFSKALASIKALHEAKQSIENGPDVERELQFELGQCLQCVRGYAAPEVAAAYERARELCKHSKDPEKEYRVLRGLFVFYTVSCQFDAARREAEQCDHLGKEIYEKNSKKPEYLIESYNAAGYVHFYQGDVRQAYKTFKQAVELYRRHHGHQLQFLRFVPQDPAVAALSALSLAAWMLGNDSEATQYSKEALELATQLNLDAQKGEVKGPGRPFDLAYAHCFVAMLENMRGCYERAEEYAHKTLTIALQYELKVWQGAGVLHLAIAKGALGKFTEACDMLSKALQGWEGSGAKLNLSFFLAGVTDIYRAEVRRLKALYSKERDGLASKIADLERQARGTIEMAIGHAEQCDEHFYDSALYRIRGELLASGGISSFAAAEKDFCNAIESAQKKGLKMLELLAATSWFANCGSANSRLALEEALCKFCESDADIPEVQKGYALLREKQKI